MCSVLEICFFDCNISLFPFFDVINLVSKTYRELQECMKKQNNRYRNGNNNNGYTLNYKFDSVSIAGKVSGTALDLIRKYNDLAKEAQSCVDYVEMEIYRQYAEHYRKIVTDINERRQTRQENNNRHNEQEEQIVETQVENKSEVEITSEPIEPEAAPNGYVETLPATENVKKV